MNFEPSKLMVIGKEIRVMFSNWVYEQELDSLLWKIDYKDLIVNENTPTKNTFKSSKGPNKQVNAKKPSIAICSMSSPNLTGINGSTHDKVKRAGETFVLKLYGASSFESLDKYRHIAYKRAIARCSPSSSFQLASLPPTSAAAKKHSYRNYHTVQEWMGNTLPPIEWEWRSHDGTLAPVETDRPVAPESLLNMMSQIRSSQVSLSSNPDTDFRYSLIYCQIATYRGNICAIKKIKKKGIEITRAMKKELKLIRDLRHDNLNAFIGACVDPPNICIVTEYCSRGSLQDILQNEEVKLDQMFIASLIEDIIRGMLFLHYTPIKSHGNLKTSNCLVDSRWVVKIADFGLHEFLAGAEPDKDAGLAFESHCTELLTRAPELLRNTNPPPYGTQKADVYSFGFIMYEIHARKGPWGPTELIASEIIKMVMKHDKINTMRPDLEIISTTFDCVRETLIDCWKDAPEERPDFKQIRTKLRPMRKGILVNELVNELVDALVNDLETAGTTVLKKTIGIIMLNNNHQCEDESY
ncbi:Resact receptor [Nymphon striatum]|nr:Resact receptor [Nymphon striatum]